MHTIALAAGLRTQVVLQSQIIADNPDGKPLGIILWADKDKLSSFGTQKGYPVIARLANLDGEIRNGVSFGGGRIVGLIPIVGPVFPMTLSTLQAYCCAD
jgi:hypothetical protein